MCFAEGPFMVAAMLVFRTNEDHREDDFGLSNEQGLLVFGTPGANYYNSSYVIQISLSVISPSVFHFQGWRARTQGVESHAHFVDCWYEMK
ncbi:hypothetical protein M0802_007568 [Mischocyttarus mexicanus]|nr:hypothetical protein M0802_007568 [Mischocyttarus mexicanus]